MNLSITAPATINATIAVPPSKSISARALVIHALSDDGLLPLNLSLCDDTHALLHGLDVRQGTIDVGAAGTAMRFLTAFHALQPHHSVVITGDERMQQRPIAPLVDALRCMGANITYAGREGFPPLRIEGALPSGGGHVVMRGDVSSQFASAIMMMAPVAGGLEIELTGNIVSAPYIELTIAVMRHYGVECLWSGNVITIPAGNYLPRALTIEADWSSASYWLALQALLPHSHIVLKGLLPDSPQGDMRMLTFMEQMGMRARFTAQGPLETDMGNAACCCCSTFADLNGTPDIALTLIVMLCLLGRPFRLTGLRTLAIKESNRLEALQQELLKLGYCISLEGDDAVSWHFHTCAPQAIPHIHTHGDHRIAMAMAAAATRHPGIVIRDAQVVQKSYPDFWKHLSAAGFTIMDVNL